MSLCIKTTITLAAVSLLAMGSLTGCNKNPADNTSASPSVDNGTAAVTTPPDNTGAASAAGNVTDNSPANPNKATNAGASAQ